MASKTARFGLNTFGGDVDGGLSDDGQKFTGQDRQVMDRVLAAFESHDHVGGERLGDPSGAPTGVLNAASGTLLGGRTYYYVTTYVDQFGLESARSAELAVATPDPVAAPQNPGLSTSAGGTLAVGLYQYATTAHEGAGETTLSGISAVSVRDYNTVNVTFTAPAGADAISVWRQGPTESGFTRLETIAIGASPYVDDGTIPAEPCPCDPDNLPPDTNTTGSTNTITVTAAAGDLTQPTLAKRWRIYRSTTSGAYSNSSLLAEVSDTTTDGGTQLVEEYEDDGSGSLTSGAPPLTSRTLAPSTPVGGGGGGGLALLRSADGTIWQITAQGWGGSLVTTAVDMGTDDPDLFADLGFELTDPVSLPWRVTVGNDGILTTTQEEAEVGEVSSVYGAGPSIPTFDAAVVFRLGVDESGGLVTHGNRTPTAVEGVGVRRFIVSATEPTGVAEGDIWIDIS